MMDTDKKRKTIRCQKCGLTFSGERVYCPLCKKRIIAEGTADSSIKEDFDVFPVTQKKQADFIFMKIVTFAALAAVIVAGMVDRMMVLSDRTWQPIFFLVVIGVSRRRRRTRLRTTAWPSLVDTVTPSRLMPCRFFMQ